LLAAIIEKSQRFLKSKSWFEDFKELRALVCSPERRPRIPTLEERR